MTSLFLQCIPVIISGKDVVAMARTGSGKTAAYLLPLLEHLKTHSAKVMSVGTRYVGGVSKLHNAKKFTLNRIPINYISSFLH